jgi:hypothetical protein
MKNLLELTQAENNLIKQVNEISGSMAEKNRQLLERGVYDADNRGQMGEYWMSLIEAIVGRDSEDFQLTK